jgi:hypothetical protein
LIGRDESVEPRAAAEPWSRAAVRVLSKPFSRSPTASGDHGSPMHGWPLMPIESSLSFAPVTVIELMSPDVYATWAAASQMARPFVESVNVVTIVASWQPP